MGQGELRRVKGGGGGGAAGGFGRPGREEVVVWLLRRLLVGPAWAVLITGLRCASTAPRTGGAATAGFSLHSRVHEIGDSMSSQDRLLPHSVMALRAPRRGVETIRTEHTAANYLGQEMTPLLSSETGRRWCGRAAETA